MQLHNVPWEQYEALLAVRGESSAVRMTYLNGTLELMVPGKEHEDLKKRLARLIEAYADDNQIRLEGLGSWTIKVKHEEKGAEPDECYILGSTQGRTEPDFAIEVVITSGGMPKLDVYRGLGVAEVWFFSDGKLQIHRLHGDQYRESARSQYLPDLDPQLVERCMGAASQYDAVQELRRDGSGKSMRTS